MPVPGIDTSEPQEQQFKWEGHPLVRVRGKLKDLNMVTGTEGFKSGRQYVRFELMNIKVLEAVEPYEFPTWSLDVEYPERMRAGTQWDAMSKSFRGICGDAADMNDLIGKEVEFLRTPEAMVNQKKRDEDGNVVQEIARYGSKKGELVDAYHIAPGWAWVISWVDGYAVSGGQSFDDAVVELAVGKTDQEFAQAYINDSELKSMFNSQYMASAESVMNRSMLPNMVLLGRLKKDGDRYVKA